MHFITSRICGICGDNHATCSCYAQNMAYGVKPPHLGEWIVNLGEAAEYMFDHNIFQENLVGVDYCERMVRETNPGVLAKAEHDRAPHAGAHGYKTIADIMRALNPFTGEFYREALQVSRYTREMFCLMEGRHVHPSTLYPGGVGTVATIQLFTDYITRLMRYVEFMKQVVPMHDDLFDFFYEALPGYEQVGLRRMLLGCWGAFQDPEYCNFDYKDMTDWGRKMFVTPGVVVDGKLVTTDLVEINLGIRILLGSSYYEDWDGPGDVRHATTRWATRSTAATRGTSTPTPSRRSATSTTSTAGSCRRAGTTARTTSRSTPAAARWPACGRPRWPAWSTSATSRPPAQRPDQPAEDRARRARSRFEWKIPQWSNTIERNRARTYFQAYAAACALHFAEKALAEVRAGHTKTWEPFKVPDEAIGCGFTEAVRGVLSHHMVIRDGKIANYHPYPPTPWNASPRDVYGTPGPVRGRGAGHADLRGERRENFKGIDIMRTVRSFDPCLPCGVHMYLGDGKTLEKLHSPTQSAPPSDRRLRPARAEPIDLRAAGDRIEALLDGAAAGWTGARERAEELVRARGRPLRRRSGAAARDRSTSRRARRRGAATRSPATTWSPSLLVVHDLHPYDVADRVERALDAVRPYLGSHGGDVELLGSTRRGRVVRLRLLGQLRRLPVVGGHAAVRVEGAIEAAAPEVVAHRGRGAHRRPAGRSGGRRVDAADPGRARDRPDAGLDRR